MRTCISGVNPMIFKQYWLIIATHPSAGGDGWADALANFCATLLGCHDERLIVSPHSKACGYRLRNLHRTGKSGILRMVVKNQRLVSMLLCA